MQLGDAEVLERTAARSLSWIGRGYIVAFCVLPTLLMLAIFCGTGEWSWLVAEHALLGAGAWLGLRFLSDRPLLNPVQAVVFFFHFWFGIGSASCAAFYCLTRDPIKFDVYYRSDFGTLAIVAAGLPLYGLIASLALHHWPERWTARFLAPEGTSYALNTLRAFFICGALVYGLLFALKRMGIEAFESVNYLGGSVSTSPALAALAALTQLANGFALYGFLHAWFAEPDKVRRFRWLGIVGIFVLAGLNLFSGSKGMVVFVALAPLILFFNFKQRIPAVALACLACAYMLLLQPFVDNARKASELEKITTPEQRQELFMQYISSGAWSVERLASLNMESPFRYMYASASRVTPLAEDFEGPWRGKSVEDGVSSMLPRFIDKNKADSNMGNYFARELGLAHPHNYMHNVTLTIPFEIVGNYGWIAGILSFGIMGAVVAAGSAWLLSAKRLASHPLTPMAILMLLKVEASCGQFVNAYKGFPVVLLAAWGIWAALGRKL